LLEGTDLVTAETFGEAVQQAIALSNGEAA